MSHPMTRATEPGRHGTPDHTEHPSDLKYVKVAVFLAVVTALEVALYYLDLGRLTVPLLMLLAIVKFSAVAAYFMHLRFDSRLLRRLFVMGIILALSVYVATLWTMGVLQPW